MNILEIGLAFLEGLALIASPCILPVLPLILSASIDGGQKRPFGIIIGFVLTFALFALLSRELVSVLHINLDYIKDGSLILLGLLGVVMLSEKLSGLLSGFTQKLANTGSALSATNSTKKGFLSGILIGGLIGLVWTPCAGPILATVLVQVIRQENNLSALFLILAFAIGAGVPMLIISLTGRKLMHKLTFLNTHAKAIRKTLGILILASVTFIASGVDAQTLFSSPSTTKNALVNGQLQNALDNPYPAPQFAKSDIWLNTPDNKPLTMDGLKGKVVLIDFWTYSCINCIRTLPYIKSWYEKYHDKGLVIVGVHAPEFEFEKNKDNVMAAITKNGIKYPVAMDNHLDTWTNFKNHYWPAHYLINQEGNVVYTHFGEGEYERTENNIRVLLGLDGADINQPQTQSTGFHFNQTPETYLGYERSEEFQSPELSAPDVAKNYTLPLFLSGNHWALAGKWIIGAQRVVTQEPNTKLALNFNAQHVYLVLGTSDGKPVDITLKLNGKPIGNAGGKDVKNNKMTIQEHRLYELVNQGKSKNSYLEIEASKAGLEAYAFTFG